MAPTGIDVLPLAQSSETHNLIDLEEIKYYLLKVVKNTWLLAMCGKQKLFIAGKPLNAYKTVRNWVRIQGYTTIWIVSSFMPSIAAVSDKQMLQMGEI